MTAAAEEIIIAFECANTIRFCGGVHCYYLCCHRAKRTLRNLLCVCVCRPQWQRRRSPSLKMYQCAFIPHWRLYQNLILICVNCLRTKHKPQKSCKNRVCIGNEYFHCFVVVHSFVHSQPFPCNAQNALVESAIGNGQTARHTFEYYV